MNVSLLCGLVTTQSVSKTALPTRAAVTFVIRYPVGMPTAKSRSRGKTRDDVNICGHLQKKKISAHTFPMTASNGRFWPAVEGESDRFKYWSVHSIIPPKSHTNRR